MLQTTIREDDGTFFRRIRPAGFPRSRELPGILIGKLALDQSLQGRQLGFDLLADAYFVASEAVMLIGGVVLVVDPMNTNSRIFTASLASRPSTVATVWCSTSASSARALRLSDRALGKEFGPPRGEGVAGRRISAGQGVACPGGVYSAGRKGRRPCFVSWIFSGKEIFSAKTFPGPSP